MIWTVISLSSEKANPPVKPLHPAQVYASYHKGHRRKKKYANRFRAWQAILSIWWRERKIDSLRPYTCRWHDNQRKGQTAAPHLHIGHDRDVRKRYRRWRQTYRKRFYWPCYRLRRKLHRLIKGRK